MTAVDASRPLDELLFDADPCTRSLPDRVVVAITDQFVRYLLHAQSFIQTMQASNGVIADYVRMRGDDGPSVADLRRIVKARLAHVIDESFYSIVYRPALMRLGVGDHSLVERMSIHPDILRVADANRRHVRASIARIQHPATVVGPTHARMLEAGVLERTEQHTSKFAWRRARFLRMGESSRKHADIVGDLQFISIRVHRWYYPFRTGIHMDNTVRNAITNRGLSYVKHHTRQCRSRMLTDPATGITVNMEARDDAAMERYPANTAEERDAQVRIDVARLCERTDTVGEIVRLLSDHDQHDAGLDWIARHADVDTHSGDVIDVVRATDRSLPYWVGHYLHRPPSEIREALSSVQRLVA